MTTGERVAAAALAIVGARFRLHGRDPATGLDCVGVVAVALRAAGHVGPVPDGYRLHSGDARRFAACWAGLMAADGAAVGDVLLCRAGAGQVHLAVRAGAGIVHADAMLRRVVERPGAVPWPVLMAWRIGES